MKNNTRKQAKQVIHAIQSRKLEELALTAVELAALKNHRGLSGLHFAAEYQCLDQIKDGVTAEQLSQTGGPGEASALLVAAHFGSLHQIKGGVTVAQLKAQTNADGTSGLMYAAQEGYLHQIVGDITAGELAEERLNDNTSALHHAAVHGQLYLLKDGVTADELAAARVNDGKTALHAAASSRCLDQIKGGVTLAQMTAIKDDQGRMPLYWAAREGCLNQISGGITAEQMKAIICDGTHSAWDIASQYQNDDQIPGTDTANVLARARAEDGSDIWMAQMACEGAVHEFKSGNRKIAERLLIKAAIDVSWSGEACGFISEAYRELGNLKEAFKFAVKAVERAPEVFPVWLNLGCTCLGLNKYQQAVSALERCLQLNPRCAQAMSMLATAKAELGHSAAEVEALSRKAVEIDPEYLAGWQWLATYLESVGKHEESDQAHAHYCALIPAQKAESEGETTTPLEIKSIAETATTTDDPVAAELEFKAIMGEAARLHPDLAAQVDALEQNLVTAFGIPVTHLASVSISTKGACQPAWLGNQRTHLATYRSELPPLEMLRHRAINLVNLQMQSECAQATGWVVLATNPTPVLARQNYLKHGFGTVAKALVRAGNDEEDVRDAQIELIQNMTAEMVNAIQMLMVGHRLSKTLPGLLTENLLIPNGKSWNPGDAEAANEVCGLAPQKIARRWRILQHAIALFFDGLAGTSQAELFFKNQDGRDEAVRIADYCRQAIGTMKPGDEIDIVKQVIRMARSQDFVSLLKLHVDLDKVRNAPGADVTQPKNLSTPEKVDLWLKYLAEAEAELIRAAGRTGPKAISGVQSLSHGRNVVLQGRKGQIAIAGFFTNDPDIAKELPFIEKRLTDRCYEMKLIEPENGSKYWTLVTKFEPLKGYSMKDRMSVGAYLANQAEALDEFHARN